MPPLESRKISASHVSLSVFHGARMVVPPWRFGNKIVTEIRDHLPFAAQMFMHVKIIHHRHTYY